MSRTSPSDGASGILHQLATTKPGVTVPAGEDWSLVTAPDEQRRCCLVLRGRRCEHVTSFRVASADGVHDDYTYVCRCHLDLVRRTGDVVISLPAEP